MASPSDERQDLTRKPSLHILLVEDHPLIAEATRQLLVGFGHEVQTADSLAAALQLFDAHFFDLLISDIQLPDGTGWDLLQILLRRRPLPAIALSGLSDPLSLRRSEEAGFLAHLAKPVNVHLLQQTIDRLLNSP